MGRIVAVGGADTGVRQTMGIDQAIVSLTGKRNPAMLYVANASGDNREYAQAVCGVYEELGCRARGLFLLTDTDDAANADMRIAEADIVYASGAPRPMRRRPAACCPWIWPRGTAMTAACFRRAAAACSARPGITWRLPGCCFRAAAAF